jgi:HSP20 family protein
MKNRGVLIMTTLVRWNPNRTFFNEFDRLFDASPRLHRQIATNWSLAVDVAENEDGYFVKASVPGINPDDLEIMLEDGVLTIKAEVNADEEIAEDQYHVRERRYGSFSRSIRFPTDVNAEAIEASYDYGVLTLDVPKAEEVKPKRISIKAV